MIGVRGHRHRRGHRQSDAPHLRVPGCIEQRGEPIINPISGADIASASPVGGFEFKTAEIGRGWTRPRDLSAMS
jgi:hypothetical protein